MEKRLKKICRIAFLLSFVFFVSCEKDLYEEVLHVENKKVIMRDFSINELSGKSNSKLLNKIYELKNRNKQKIQNQDGKIVYDSINGFYFDDENGKYIDNGNDKSYVFPVYRLDNVDSNIEKVVFSEVVNGDYKIYLVKYGVTPQELINLDQQEAMSLNVQYIDITSKYGMQVAIMCFQTWEYLNTNDLVGADSPAHFEWVVTGENCVSITEQQSTDMGGGGETSQGGAVILSTPSHSGAPLTPGQLHAIVHSEFISTMSEAQHNWWVNPVNASSVVSITNYLTNHTYSIAAESFVYEMIDMCLANNSNFTFSNSVNPTNGLVFNSVNDFQNYLDSNSITPSFYSFEAPSQQNGHKAYFRFNLTFTGGVLVTADVVNNSNGTSTVTSASSSQTGLYVMSEWTQIGAAGITTLQNGTVKIVVTGSVQTNAVIQAIGLKYSSTYELTMIYNPNNGILIFSSIIKIN